MSAAALDYSRAVAELRARGRFGTNLGLERISAILDALANPERRLRGALVGGTNGKGSVVALARSALGSAGHRVGTMPKPHLVSYRERIAIDGAPIEPASFADAIEAVLPAVEEVTRRLGPPTEFEVLTAAAFAWLADRVELALVEVGLGGRLDATNVLDAGVAVITTVQHDHERYLGRSLSAIGTEKAAIIKPGNAVATGARGNGLRPILARCAALGLTPRRSGPGQAYQAVVRAFDWDGLVVDLRTPDGTLGELRVGLLGRHQAANAATAAALLDAMREDGERRGRGLGVAESDLRRGFEAARWPGRLELLRDTAFGPVLLDGAHNPAGARVLADALAELGVRRFPLVFGASRGKRVTAMLRALAPLEPRPLFTRVADAAAVDEGALRARWDRLGTGSPARVAATPGEALRLAADLRTAGDQPLVVAGSLYLVGAIRGMLLGQEEP